MRQALSGAVFLLGAITAACGGVVTSPIGEPDAGSDAVPDGSGNAESQRFACGPHKTCSSATQFCSAYIGPLGDPGSHTCVGSDQGVPPTCENQEFGPPVMSPGQCGCYQSPTGDVTITYCGK
jgi:hypothetical protein